MQHVCNCSKNTLYGHARAASSWCTTAVLRGRIESTVATATANVLSVCQCAAASPITQCAAASLSCRGQTIVALGRWGLTGHITARLAVPDCM